MDEKKVLIDCKQDESHRALLIQRLKQKIDISGSERSLAKTTKLVNRLRRFYSETNVDQILAELSKLDLTMYIEEAVASLMEGYRSMRLRDSNTFLLILCDLQTCYPQLGNKFIEYHQKCLESVMQDNLRLRIYLRTITELVLLGICVSEVSVELVSLLKNLLTFTPQTISGEILATRLNAIVYWVSRYHGVCLDRSTLDGNGSYELVTSEASFPESIRTEIEEMLSTFFHKKVPKIINHIKSLIENEERRHEAQMINKGIIDPESVTKHETLKTDLDKLETAHANIQKIMQFQVDIPSEPIPEIPVEANGPETPAPEDLQFSDDSERSFYLELIDLNSRLPSAVLETQKSQKLIDDSFIDRIKSISLSDEADKLAIEFFESSYNCEPNLVRIPEILFGNHPVDPVQLRFIATIARHVPHEFSEAIVDDLRRQAKLPFKQGSHSQIQISAIKNLGELAKFSTCPPGVIIKLIRRFIDEFDAHNAEMASWVLVACGRFLVNKPEVADLMEEQITRLVKLRNSSTIHLPRRIEIMVDHAYYTAKPRQDTRARSNRIVREKSQMEKYIDHIVHVEIYRMHEDTVLRLVRKLPWADETVVQSLREGIMDFGMNANFDKSYCIASLLAGLVKYKESFVVDIIDDILERFQIALEKDDFRQSPYRVRLAKLIAELYVYKLVDANTIFDLLFQLIGFRDTSCYGASEHTVLLALWDEEEADNRCLKHQAAIEEPSWSNVRIILISTILTTCGEFFVTGRNKIKLRRFLLCLRRYVVLRSLHLSSQVVNILADLFEFLGTGKVHWDMGVDQIDVELEKVVENIRNAPSAANVVLEDDASSEKSEPTSESDDSEEESESDSSSSDEAYTREQESRRGGELAEFDKDLQSILIESITEGKNSSNRVSWIMKPPPVISVEHDGDVGQAGTFRVITRAKSSPSKTAKIIQVPETNKLNQSQEKYKAELEAAQKEKQAIKRFIMEYQRREERESIAPNVMYGNRPAPPTLAMAAGLTDDALDAGEKPHHAPTRRKYRKL